MNMLRQLAFAGTVAWNFNRGVLMWPARLLVFAVSLKRGSDMAGPERHPNFVLFNFAKEPCKLYQYIHASER